jgi:ATP adenylyltransferase
MVVPYEHAPSLEAVAEDTLLEMILLARQAETHLRANYQPDGLNMGINVGKAAGAGVAGHIHMHVLPRWVADANFMTTVGETRVLPEDLAMTYEKLSRAWRGGAPA